MLQTEIWQIMHHIHNVHIRMNCRDLNAYKWFPQQPNGHSIHWFAIVSGQFANILVDLVLSPQRSAHRGQALEIILKSRQSNSL